MINILTSHTKQESKTNIKILKKYLENTKGVLVLLYSFFSKYIKTEDSYNNHYNDESDYVLNIKESFLSYGVDLQKLHFVYYYLTTYQEIKSMIKNCDTIYFPGGSPDEMIDRIEKMNIKDLLINEKFTYIGSSAGAMIQTKLMFITPDNDYKTFILKNGLPLITSYLVEVHSHDNSTQKYIRYIKKYSDHKIISLGEKSVCVIKDNIIIDGNKFKVINK